MGRRTGEGAQASLALMLVVGGLGCGGSSQLSGIVPRDAAAVDDAGSIESPDAGGNADTDASGSADASAGPACPVPAAPTDLCGLLPAGTIGACSHDATGQPSSNGYLEIRGADGSRKYVCATAWTPGISGGYFFDHPELFMADAASCCGTTTTPVVAPTAPQPAIGYLGALHAPKDIKPQESAQPGAGLIRQNPFAVIIENSSGTAAFTAARTMWMQWAGDGQPHPGLDGTGAYYFPLGLVVNYAILETADGRPVVVIAPEVSPTSDGSEPLGHPTLGACAGGGGAALALIAGELSGTMLSNHSGRFGYDPAETPEALSNAAKLFNCLGISINATKYYVPQRPDGGM